MTTGVLSPTGVQKFFDSNGNPLAFGLVYTYQAGTSTLTPTYTDSTLGTANANPIVLNFRGEAPIWLTPGQAYKLNVTDAAGNQIPGWPVDQIQGAGVTQASLGLALWPQTSVEAAAGVTPTYYFYPPYDVRRYGNIGDGVTDDTAAMLRAIAVLNNGSAYIQLSGWHVVNSTLTVTRSSSSIVGFASMQQVCGFLFAGTIDGLIFQAPTPSNGISNCAIRDFAILSNTATPTAGRGLSVIFGRNFQASNIQIVTCYQGLNIQGGYAQNWVNTLIFGPAGWTTRQAGTYAVRIEIGPGNSIPSEISFSNFDWKGVTNVTNGMDFGLWILCCDGLFFSNGHVGFAYTASIAIASAAGAPSFVDSVNVDNVYFDGNFGGAGSGLQISGTAGNINNVNFSSCSFRNHVQHGITCSYSGTSFTSFWNCNVQNNGQYGVIWNAGTDFAFFGGIVFNNNTANVGANGFSILGIVDFTVQGVKIYGTGFPYATGISADITSSGGSVIGNSFRGCTVPMNVVSPLTTFAGNRLLGAVPSVVAAATLPATMWGFDYVQVTGNTAITAFAGANIAGQEMTLAFTGTPTVTRGNNILLTSGGGNMVATAGSTLRVANDGTGWREVARAVA